MDGVQAREPNMSWASPSLFHRVCRRRTWRASLASLLALLFAGLAGGAAVAQTCEIPQTLRSDPLQSASTCSGDLSIASVCNGQIPIHGPVYVWRLQVGAGATAVLQLLGAEPGFNPVGYLVAADVPCGAGGCYGHVDPMLDLANVPPGDYHVIVAASAWDAPGACVSYSLSVDGDFGDAHQVFADEF